MKQRGASTDVDDPEAAPRGTKVSLTMLPTNREEKHEIGEYASK